MTRLLLTADTVGGVWHYATDLARGLAEHGVEAVIATIGPKASAAQRACAPCELLDTGLPLDWLAATYADVTDAGRQLARLANRIGADIVQLNAPAFAADARFDQPVVAVAHSCVGTWWQAVRGGPIDPDLAWRAEQTAAGLRTADRVVAPSAAFAAALTHCYALPSPPAVVRNGRHAADLPLQEADLFAFTAGRLWDEGKNVALLDRVAAALSLPLRAAGPVSGPNGAAAALTRLELLGPLDGDGVARQLASRPIFISPALYEPFGLAVLEAAQAGCALVLSDIPTFRELWDGCARFVYAHDAEGFARAIEEIAADPALRARLGDAACRRAADCSVARMAAGMADIYAGLALAPARAAA